MYKKITLVLVLFFFMISLSACSFSWPWQNENKEINDDTNIDVNTGDDNTDDDNTDNDILDESDLEFKKFSDYNELKEFVELNYSDIPEARDYNEQINYEDAGLDSSLGTSNSGTFGSQGSFASVSDNGMKSNDYSETNVQVEGVDEADVMKTDGKYIYIIVNDKLHIVDALPASNSEIISTTVFDSRPKEMYVRGDRLVVLGLNTDESNDDKYPFNTGSEFTFVNIFDISDVRNPKIIRNLNFEGDYLDSRSIDGKMYLNLSQRVKTDVEENLLPILIEDGKIISNDCSTGDKCFSPNIYYSENDNYSYNSHKLISINSIDFENQGDIISSQAFLSKSNSLIYSSLKNIYITNTEELDYERILIIAYFKYLKPLVSEEDRQEIDEIINSDSIISFEDLNKKLDDIVEKYDINPTTEEETNILKDVIKENEDNLIKTNIYKFSLNNGYLNFEKSSFVPGYISNQFFLDEDEFENLRIVSTQMVLNDDYEASLFSNLFVLSPELKILNSVRRLAENEDVYSVRFLGERAYIVTFEVIDPLFVIDLSNPIKPVLMGELKIPGYSKYIHPYDENTLIGFGRDTSLSDWGSEDEGLKLSLFDVKDPSSPKELDNYIIGNERSDSLALYNHKAFLFDKKKNLLVVPAFLSGYLENGSSMGGVMVLSIDDNKFNLKGVIDHSDNGLSSYRDYFCGQSCYDNSVQRSLYINDVLYTFSNKYLKANNINDLEELNAISLIDEEAESLKRDAERLDDVRDIRTGLEMYFSNENRYPEEEKVSTGNSIETPNKMIFLNSYPSPPSPVNDDICKTTTKGSQEYTYELNNSQSYSIHFCLESDTNEVSAGHRTMTPYGIY
ncbi:MAG: beta-propeller domain-containing protein [Patescibacteria group bacterium]|jgi:inhibitor of cysteine peptidase|nr:beta-propeller domain-containing protein [Patescibacteria group bacterium]